MPISLPSACPPLPLRSLPPHSAPPIGTLLCLPCPPMTLAKLLTIPLDCRAAASHSTVPFPVAAYLERIQRMAEELAAARLPQVAQQAAGLPQAQAQQALLQAVEAYLYEERGFAVPAFGRSNLPRRWVAG